MANENDDTMMVKVVTFLPKHHHKFLRDKAKSRRVSMSRLLSFSVDNEMLKEIPFEFRCDLPEGEFVEYAYADEATKILDYVRTLRKGAALDIMLMLRFDIGIPDKDIFLAAFKECLEKGMIESFVPKPKYGQIFYGDDYLYYRLAGQPTTRSRKMKTNRHAQYLKLKKEFENEE